MLDQLVGDRAVLVVEVVEVASERVAFKLVLNGSRHEAAQAPVAVVLLNTSSEPRLDADGPLASSHTLILPK